MQANKPIHRLLLVAICGLLGAAQSRGQTAQPRAGLSVEEQMRLRRMEVVGGRAPASRPIDQAAISLFVKIEQVARLNVDQRRPQIPAFYLDAAEMMTLAAEGSLSSIPANLLQLDGSAAARSAPPVLSPFIARSQDPYIDQLNAAAATMTPQQVAERIHNLHGPSILRVAARRRALQIGKENIADLTPLISADLAATEPVIVRRAANYIHTLSLKEFLDPAMAIYLANGPTAEAASWAISWVISEPDIAKRLIDDIEKNPSAISRHFLIVSSALRNEPPDARLVKMLDAKDSDARYFAAFCLDEIVSSERIKLLPKLLHDDDLQIKMLAIRSTFDLEPEAFAAMRETIVVALIDPNASVRLAIADGLAGKRDMAAAQTLLEFLNAPQAPKWINYPAYRVSPTAPPPPGQRGRPNVTRTESEGGMQVLMAIARLMNTGGRRLSYNTANWGPDDPQNVVAIDEFERWIAQNKKP